MRRARVGLGMLVLSLATAHVAAAEPYEVGDAIRAMRLTTQFDEEVEVGAATRLVLITHDMGAGDVAKAVLAAQTADTLAARGAVYVADISRMPGLVSRLIAIPRMRRRSYPVLLDRTGETGRLFPAMAGAVTAVWLENGRITRLEQLVSEEGVRAALEP